jgi:hypothetical protein
MKTYDLIDDSGRLFAFEVPSRLGRVGIRKIIEKIPGAKILKFYGYFATGGEDIRGEFELNGKIFDVFEPFGDNSRYWIGPKHKGFCDEINIIRETFIKGKIPLFSFLSS